MAIFMKTFPKLCSDTLSMLASKLFEFVYQYVGIMRDIFTTISGNHSVGINAPQRKAEPRATTLTIPVIAPLLLVRLDIKRAIVNVQKVNTKVFKAYITPLSDNIVSFKTNIPSITN